MTSDPLHPIREALYVEDTDRPADVLAGMIRDLFRTEAKRCDEIRTLRARVATLEAERDALRARVEIAERIVPVAESYRVALQAIKDSDHSPRCRWKRQHAGRAIRVDCDCHCMMARRALDGAR